MAIHGHYHLVLQGTAASRPATPGYDLLYIATDTGAVSYYDTVGAAWVTQLGGAISAPVTIGQGGTGQTTQTAAFDALSPTTTKGDLIVDDGTNAVRVAAGSDQRIIIYDSSQAQGIRISDYASESMVMVSPTGVALSYITTAAYAMAIPAGSLFRGFARFREGRLTMWAALQIASANCTAKVVDTTNSQDMTGVITVNNTTAQRFTSSWASLNSATYAGDAEFEIQAKSAAGGDTLKIFSAQLELR